MTHTSVARASDDFYPRDPALSQYPLPPPLSMTHTSVARASDDFYPRDPASSHPHLAACAFNGLFMSVLVQPDWDMFHSKHISARLHAMAR